MTLSGTSARAPRVALYARTSTQRDQSPAMQLDALRRMAEHRQWEVVGEFVDHGYSGSRDRRPELDRLVHEMHSGRRPITTVACWRFDRIARSVRHLVTFLDDCRARGIDFISLNDGIDTSTPTGRFTFHVIAAAAQLEVEILRERTRCGLEAARRRGVVLGRRRVRVDLDRAMALRREGASFAKIADALGISVGTVHRAVTAALQESPPSEAPPTT